MAPRLPRLEEMGHTKLRRIPGAAVTISGSRNGVSRARMPGALEISQEYEISQG